MGFPAGAVLACSMLDERLPLHQRGRDTAVDLRHDQSGRIETVVMQKRVSAPQSLDAAGEHTLDERRAKQIDVFGNNDRDRIAAGVEFIELESRTRVGAAVVTGKVPHLPVVSQFSQVDLGH